MTTDSTQPPALPRVGGFPEPDGDQPMSPAEVRMVRTFLGLSQEQLAGLLGADVKTVKRWEGGYYDVPDHRREQIEALEAEAAHAVGVLVEQLGVTPDMVLSLPRDPATPYPSGWWMMIAARVAQEVPGLYVRYTDA